jgi:hypothetical protein
MPTFHAQLTCFIRFLQSTSILPLKSSPSAPHFRTPSLYVPPFRREVTFRASQKTAETFTVLYIYISYYQNGYYFDVIHPVVFEKSIVNIYISVEENDIIKYNSATCFGLSDRLQVWMYVTKQQLKCVVIFEIS